jgi:hypothetical protein
VLRDAMKKREGEVGGEEWMERLPGKDQYAVRA